MIELTCAKCRNILRVDNAFAGGVCRCSHCGAIQTVPVRRRSTVPVPASPSDSSIAGAPAPGAGTPSGSGLDELADIISSSTLTGTGLVSNRLRGQIPASSEAIPSAGVTSPPASSRFPQAVVVISGAAGVLIIALLGVIIYLLIDRTPPAIVTGAEPGQVVVPRTDRHDPSAPEAGGIRIEPLEAAGFCGVPIDGRTVVYVIDRGSATQSGFGYLKEACFRSIKSLGSQRRFQIIFWDNGSGTDAVWPANSTTAATSAALEEARLELGEVFAFGQSDAEKALVRALSHKPDDIVLVTGKGWDLDERFVSMVMRHHSGSPRTRIHTFAIGGSGDSRTLKTIADNTSGTYRELSVAQLRAFSY